MTHWETETRPLVMWWGGVCGEGVEAFYSSAIRSQFFTEPTLLAGNFTGVSQRVFVFLCFFFLRWDRMSRKEWSRVFSSLSGQLGSG